MEASHHVLHLVTQRDVNTLFSKSCCISVDLVSKAHLVWFLVSITEASPHLPKDFGNVTHQPARCVTCNVNRIASVSSQPISIAERSKML